MKNIKIISVIFCFVVLCFASSGQLWLFTGNQGPFDIFFYLLGLCFIALQIFFGGARGLAAIVLPFGAALTYMIGRLVFDGTAAFMQAQLLADLIGLILVVLLTWVSGLYSSVISDFLKAADELILIKDKSKVRSFKNAIKDVQVELDRSRRHDHPISIVVFEPDKSTVQQAHLMALAHVQSSIFNKLVIGKLGNILHQQIREHDSILYQEDSGRFVLICPETGVKPITFLVNRLRVAAKNSMGINFKCGTATFPDESLTLEELMITAERSLDDGPVNIEQLIGRPSTNKEPEESITERVVGV